MKILNNGLSFLLNPIASAITKALIHLSETAGSFYSLGTDFVAAGDYSIEQYVYYSGDDIRLHGNQANFNSRAHIFGSGRVAWTPDSSGAGVAFTGNDTVPINKLSLIKVERIGTVGKIYVNGTLIVTATVPTGSVIVNANGNNGGSTLGGLLSQITLTDLTDTDNTLEFKLNELTKQYEYPVGNVFGSEEVTNGDFATGIAGWSAHNNAIIEFSSNRIKVQSDGSLVGNCYQAFTTVVGQAYEFSCILEGAAGSGAVLAVGTTSGGNGDIAAVIIEEDTTESVSGAFTATTTTTYIRVGLRTITANRSVYGSDISVKSVTNFIAYQNIGAGRSFRETYTLIGRGYFAPERIVGGNFLTPSDWNTAGESTVSAGKANIFSTTGSNTYVFQSDVMDEGKSFRVIYDVFSYTSGALKMSAVSALAVSSDVGTNTIDFIASGTSILLQRASVEPTDIVMNSISIVPYIEVAF
jgi:hypothetical protein